MSVHVLFHLQTIQKISVKSRIERDFLLSCQGNLILVPISTRG
jgi:hypothetical protein